MLLLIDGYNLLHQSDLMGRGRGERWLQRARERLLRQLERYLDESLADQTCIVFDAESPPPDRPHEYFHSGIRVLYAVGYPEADDLVEELIARHAAPQRLTVVSSDHRLQRAARRRRAHAFDAEVWYQRLLERGPQLGIRWPPDAPQRNDTPPAVPEKRQGVADASEVSAWLEWFGQSESVGDQDAEPTSEKRVIPPGQPAGEPRRPFDQPRKRSPKKTSKKKDRKDECRGAQQKGAVNRRDRRVKGRPERRDDRLGSPDKQIDPSLENPFPEGYGEDLLEDE